MPTLIDHWAGWLAIPLVAAVPLLWTEIRSRRRILWGIWLILGLQQLLAVANTFVVTMPGAEADVMRFIRDATVWADQGRWSLEIGSKFYVELLGAFFRYLQPSTLLACELSIMASALFLVTMVFLLDELELGDLQTPLLLLVGFWPSRLFLASLPLRESFQMLFFALAVTCALRARRTNGVRWWCACAASCLGLGLFHHGLALFALFLFPCLLAWPGGRKGAGGEEGGRRMLLLTAALMALTALSWCLSRVPGVDGTETLRALWSGSAVDYLQAYRERLLTLHIGAADYGLQVAAGSWETFLQSTGKIYLYYLFTPSVGMISSPAHWAAFAEMLLRTTLLVAGLFGLAGASGADRATRILLLVLYLAMTLLWALGTANFGTALRHHLLSNWLLVPFGAGPLCALFGLRSGARPRLPDDRWVG